MRRGTTPTITLTVDADLTGWTVYLALAQAGSVIVLEDDRVEATVSEGVTTLEFTLSQEETLSLAETPVELQVRAIRDGTALATDIRRLPVDRILQGGVIHE